PASRIWIFGLVTNDRRSSASGRLSRHGCENRSETCRDHLIRHSTIVTIPGNEQRRTSEAVRHREVRKEVEYRNSVCLGNGEGAHVIATSRIFSCDLIAAWQNGHQKHDLPGLAAVLHTGERSFDLMPSSLCAVVVFPRDHCVLIRSPMPEYPRLRGQNQPVVDTRHHGRPPPDVDESFVPRVCQP